VCDRGRCPNALLPGSGASVPPLRQRCRRKRVCPTARPGSRRSWPRRGHRGSGTLPAPGPPASCAPGWPRPAAPVRPLGPTAPGAATPGSRYSRPAVPQPSGSPPPRCILAAASGAHVANDSKSDLARSRARRHRTGRECRPAGAGRSASSRYSYSLVESGFVALVMRSPPIPSAVPSHAVEHALLPTRLLRHRGGATIGLASGSSARTMPRLNVQGPAPARAI
jgi:hypothetical protein